MEAHYPKIGGPNAEGNVLAEGEAQGWPFISECVIFIREVHRTAKAHPDTGVKGDAYPIGNQIVRDAFADWVADGKRLAKGKTTTAPQMLFDFERKMRLGQQGGGIAGTSPHPTFALGW